MVDVQTPDPERVPVPDWFMREVLEPVLGDLQQPRPIDVIVDMDHRGLVWFSERGQPGSFGLGHPHPAQAIERDGEAWWVCPADGRSLARIGDLH